MALPYLLFFHLLLQNELPQTGLNLQTRILIRVTQLSKAFGKTDVLHLILTVFVDGEATRPTLLRCSSWSSFLFKASSSSSSLDLLLPSEPTGSKHKPKKKQMNKSMRMESHEDMSLQDSMLQTFLNSTTTFNVSFTFQT